MTDRSTDASAAELDRLRFALQSAQIGTWTLDIAQRQVWWDAQCKELYGFRRDDVVPYDQVLSYMHDADRQRVAESISRALNPASNGYYDVQFRTVGADTGQVRWLHCRGRAEFDAEGVAYQFAGTAQDITQSVVDRQSLTEKSQDFELALSIADLGSFKINLTTQEATFSPQVMHWFGLTEPQQSMSEISARIWPADQARVLAGLANSVTWKEGGYHDLTYRIVSPVNGQLRYLHSIGQVAWEQGVAVSMTGIIRDVTQETVNRQALEKSEERFRSLIEEAPVATGLLVGPEHRIEIANQLMVNIMGKGSTVLGKPVAIALPELVGQSYLALLDQLYATGEEHSARNSPAELEVDGVLDTYYFDFTYKSLRNAAGDVYAILTMAVDVTPQVIAQQQLNQLATAQQNAIELAQLGTFSVDLTTNLLTVSPRTADWFGFDSLSADPEAFISCIEEGEQDYVRTSLYNTLQPESGGRYDVTHSVINIKTGQKIIIKAFGQLYRDATGQSVRIDGTAQDITVQRELQRVLEQQVQQRTQELAASNEEQAMLNEELIANNEEYAAINEELEEANSLLIRSNDNLQTFAYVASHDLQEPLRKIQQFGDLLKTRFTDSVQREEFAYIERMQLAASRMSSLIKDLLGFSRISTQRNSDEPVDLNQVINQVLSVLDLRIVETAAEVQVDLLPTVMGDAAQLGQLFQNIISNAIKFQRAGTTPYIQIVSQLIAIDQLPGSIKPARRSSFYCQLEVTDNGIGFDEKYLDRIFQVFQRLHGKGEFAGTGVGLAICEKVVANHGGVITARSQPGQGATFIVYLPA